MNAVETAEYMRQHYSREEYFLLTLVSCSLLLSNTELNSPEVQLVENVLRDLRESLSESELLAVSVMMAEIDRLRSEDEQTS